MPSYSYLYNNTVLMCKIGKNNVTPFHIGPEFKKIKEN